MDRALSTLTEPVGDGAALATWMLIHQARERATVFLCGHGGDEELGGYRLSQDRFRLQLLRGLRALPLAGTFDRFLHGDEPWSDLEPGAGPLILASTRLPDDDERVEVLLPMAQP